ncbi:MAG: Uma2 family endonuclease [Planctomycetaceae bacterium]|nr:Uma2 family endonuclease [Planctomycetaceae bacterium]
MHLCLRDVALGSALLNFFEKHDLGIVLGAAAPLRYRPGLIRTPDVSFFAWRHFSKRKLPKGWSLKLAPDLSIEILSPDNSNQEMELKRKECFSAGTKVVWEIDPKTRTIAVYRSPNRSTTITERGTLDGGKVLPGFKLRVKDLFKRAGEQEPE